MLRDRQFFNILTWKCASRHSGVQFFDIGTAKSGRELTCFVHFHFEMCFSLRNVLLATGACNFLTSNGKKWSGADVSCTLSLRNVLLATGACNFSTSNGKKWSGADVSCTLSLRNVLLATAAYNFLTSQLQKMLRALQFFSIFT